LWSDGNWNLAPMPGTNVPSGAKAAAYAADLTA
jgi:hypothetical protein